MFWLHRIRVFAFFHGAVYAACKSWRSLAGCNSTAWLDEPNVFGIFGTFGILDQTSTWNTNKKHNDSLCVYAPSYRWKFPCNNMYMYVYIYIYILGSCSTPNLRFKSQRRCIMHAPMSVACHCACINSSWQAEDHWRSILWTSKSLENCRELRGWISVSLISWITNLSKAGWNTSYPIGPSVWSLCLVPHLVALAISPASCLPLFLTALALPNKARRFMHWFCEPPNRHKFTRKCENLQDRQGCWGCWGPFRSFESLVIATYHSSSHRLWAAQHLSFRSSNFSRFELWKSLAFTCEVLRPQALLNSIYSVDP